MHVAVCIEERYCGGSEDQYYFFEGPSMGPHILYGVLQDALFENVKGGAGQQKLGWVSFSIIS